MILFFLFIAGSANAIDWTVANQSTIAWIPVTKTSSGLDMPEGDQIKYEVYIVKEGADKQTAIMVGETTESEFVVTFDQEGRWLAGVKTIRSPALSPEDIKKSAITWSDVIDPAVVPVPFGFVFFETPADPGGLGPK